MFPEISTFSLFYQMDCLSWFFMFCKFDVHGHDVGHGHGHDLVDDDGDDDEEHDVDDAQHACTHAHRST